jgi:ATP-dependent RNA helicase RhlE
LRKKEPFIALHAAWNVRPTRVLFNELGLIQPLLDAVARAGYDTPTPIQEQAIPPALQGRDVLGCAQTGTGKTAAFSLPILQQVDARVGNDPRLRALILTPTRELAAQIEESLATYGKGLEIWHTVIFGGVGEKGQLDELKRGVDILVATPGRLIDYLGRGLVKLDTVEIFVLDEADRMLDMGFLPDVKRVVAALPKKRQTLFFSATMPPEIRSLADGLLNDPAVVTVTPVASTAEKVEQRVYFTDKANKRRLLIDVLKEEGCERTIVFSRTKHGANRVVGFLEHAGIRSAALHGNKSQNARVRALEGFRKGELGVLVATDIAARGIDVDGVSHVINFDIPNVPETYVHRIGRTARAGASGIALSFCDDEERAFLSDIERLIQLNVPRIEDHPYPPSFGVPPQTDLTARRGGSRPAGNSGGGGQRPQRSGPSQHRGGARGKRPMGNRRPANQAR